MGFDKRASAIAFNPTLPNDPDARFDPFPPSFHLFMDAPLVAGAGDAATRELHDDSGVGCAG